MRMWSNVLVRPSLAAKVRGLSKSLFKTFMKLSIIRRYFLLLWVDGIGGHCICQEGLRTAGAAAVT